MVKKKVQTIVWKGLRIIDPNDQQLSITRQCKLLGKSRSIHYYEPKPERREDIEEKIALKKKFLEIPYYGYRKMWRELYDDGFKNTSEKRVRRLMRELGIRALSPKKFTSIPDKEHPIYPYLLRNKRIRYPNQVWVTDITYLKLETGFAYLVAIMDVYSRKVLSWKISTTLDADFCIEALKEALALHGTPAIFNTDQGCQFTSYGFIKVLKDHHIQVSMDGQGRWKDNIFIERLWKSLKYEDFYLKSYENVRELKKGIQKYFRFYNGRRYHQSLEYRTPNQMYRSFQVEEDLVA
ncbi:MAG: IS3 family transposase [Sphaerochaetaceae bacterium]|nr:IS3 family transposase [Sphaerochaetaceae bacterium]